MSDADEVIPWVEGAAPPEGHMLVQDQHGNRFWIRPEALTPSPPRTQLSPDQERRIAAFTEALAEPFPVSVEEALDNFRRDQEPEPEIRLWERIARVYTQEVADRPSSDRTERLQVFQILYQSATQMDARPLLGAAEDAMPVPQWKRVIRRYYAECGFPGADAGPDQK